MFDYLAFVYGGISNSSGNALHDGKELARQCLAELNGLDGENRFPPKLLILLASPAYLDLQNAEQLVQGVYEPFSRVNSNIKLIGSTVAGVFFKKKIHPKGALLVCLASRLIDAEVGYGADARKNPAKAVEDLLTELKLGPSKQIDPNPLANRLIITFMPGCNKDAENEEYYPAPELHRLLYEGVQSRIMLTGGVSSANDLTRRRDGLQFFQKQALRDSIVAASIITGVPIGGGLNDALSDTGTILRATVLDNDGRTILKFDEPNVNPEERLRLSPSEQLQRLSGDGKSVMLAKLSAEDERIVDIPLPAIDGSVKLLGRFNQNDYFKVVKPQSELFEILKKGIEKAKQRVFVESPIANLLFPCKTYNLCHEKGFLNFETTLENIERDLKDIPCIGGFFDGELGVDEIGRSRLTNGGISYITFGDEMRERTPLYRGVSALADYAPKLQVSPEFTSESIDEAIENALKTVAETGFPGAMISLVLSNLDRESNEDKYFVIGRDAIGQQYKKIIKQTKHSRDGDDILAIVAQEKRPRFIPDSRSLNSSRDPGAFKLPETFSQYILPLKRLDESVFGTLQVYLGDLRNLSEDDFLKTEKARMLNCLAEVFGDSLNRIVNGIENNVMIKLDKALKESMSADSIHQGLERFVAAAGIALGVQFQRLWLVKSDDNPEVSTNQTLILESSLGTCYEPENEAWRKLDANDLAPICQAFRSNGPQIINDVATDPIWNLMLDRAKDDPQLLYSLGPIKSYAAIAFKNEKNQKLGAVSFSSTEDWFFLRFHRDILNILAERMSFLVEHLEAKIQLKFLFDVSPKLAERNLDEAATILQSITDDFCTALKAKVVSLYLWDPDRKRYILRAETGWQEKDWVHAASYDENAGWMGIKAIINEPLYTSDLRQFYIDNNYDYPQGRYAKYIFGKHLSETFTVEAIGLPLRIGPEKNDKFGVLTLYRPIEKGEPSGFVSKDVRRLLREGAYNAAGLVSAVLRHLDVMWEQQEESRQQKFYQAINSIDNILAFEKRVCRQVLDCFQAVEVEFYQVQKSDKNLSLSWVTGARRYPETGRIEPLPKKEPDQLARETFSSKDVEVERKQLTPAQKLDPTVMKLENMVHRACIPLIGANEMLGILNVSWKIRPKDVFSLEVRHDKEHLKILGKMIGATYRRNQLFKESEQISLALQATAAYAVQRAHLLRNTVTQIYDLSESISENIDEVVELKNLTKITMEIVDETMDLGESVLNPSQDRCELALLINELLNEEDSPLKNKLVRLDISCFVAIPNNLMVLIDAAYTKDALFNLINNAIDGIARKIAVDKMTQTPEINIRAEIVNMEMVRLIISDNGIGMTPEEKRDAWGGFARAKDHKGVGVLLSRVLLSAQGLVFKLNSEKFVGTEAIITFPSIEREKTNDITKPDDADNVAH